MRSPRLRTIALFLAICFIAPALHAEEMAALVIEAAGTAAFVKKGETQRQPLQANQTRLAAGDRILTGPNSKVKLLIEGKTVPAAGGEAAQSVIEIKPQSRVELTQLFTDLAKGAESVAVSVSRGEVVANVRKIDTNSERFEVQTPTAVAAVRGTNFLTKVAPAARGAKPKVTFRVRKGQIAILDPVTRASRRLIEEGDILDIEPTGAMIESRAGGSTQGNSGGAQGGPGGGSFDSHGNQGDGESHEGDNDTNSFPDRNEGEEDDTGGGRGDGKPGAAN